MKNQWTYALIALVVAIVIYYVWAAKSSETKTPAKAAGAGGTETAKRMAMGRSASLNGKWCDCIDQQGRPFQCHSKDGGCNCCAAFNIQKVDLSASRGFSGTATNNLLSGRPAPIASL